MYYAALDVSLRSVSVCIIDEEGKIRFERSVSSDVPDIGGCLHTFGHRSIRSGSKLARSLSI